MGFQHSYYCRIYGFDLPTSSTNTDMRGAAGGRQLAAAETIVLLYITPGSYSAHTDAVYFVTVCEEQKKTNVYTSVERGAQ